MEIFIFLNSAKAFCSAVDEMQNGSFLVFRRKMIQKLAILLSGLVKTISKSVRYRYRNKS